MTPVDRHYRFLRRACSKEDWRLTAQQWQGIVVGSTEPCLDNRVDVVVVARCLSLCFCESPLKSVDLIDCLLLPRVIDGQETEIHNLRLWSIVTMCTFKAMKDVGLHAPSHIDLISNGGDASGVVEVSSVTIRALSLMTEDNRDEVLSRLSDDDAEDANYWVGRWWGSSHRPLLLLAESVLS